MSQQSEQMHFSCVASAAHFFYGKGGEWMKKFGIICLMLVLVLCFTACENVSEKTYPNQSSTTSDGVAVSEYAVEESKQQSAPKNTQSRCVDCGRVCTSGYSYCDRCKCWESDCPMPKKHMSSYCANHGCLLCGQGRTYGSPYCMKHKCSSCENVVVNGSRYCVAHKCLVCNNKVFGSNQYCSSHLAN